MFSAKKRFTFFNYSNFGLSNLLNVFLTRKTIHLNMVHTFSLSYPDLRSELVISDLQNLYSVVLSYLHAYHTTHNFKRLESELFGLILLLSSLV